MATKKKEPEVVEAEVIEPNEITLAVDFKPAEITANFEALAAYVTEMVEPYMGITVENEEEIETKALKSFRVWLNKLSAALNDKRKEIKAAYNEPLKAFEAQCKEIDAIILEPKNRIDLIIKQREANAKTQKRNHLEECYAEFAADNGFADLVILVPFEKLLDDKWLNASFGEKKAEALLQDKVAAVIGDWSTLQTLKGTMQYYEEAEREFFRSLSFTEAVAKNKQLTEETQNIEAIKAQMNEAQEYQQASEIQPEPVMVAPEYEPVPVDVYGLDNLEQMITDEPIEKFVLEIECTKSMLPQVGQALAALGVHGVIKGAK